MAHNAGPDWMAKLPEHLWDVPLRTLAIPGSHHSYSYAIDPFSVEDRNIDTVYRQFVDDLGDLAAKISYRWSVTQTKNLTQQLDLGIRYIDLRVTARVNGRHTFAIRGPNIMHALREINVWTRKHPKEVIFVDFREMNNLSDIQHKRLLAAMTRELFEDTMLDYTGNVNGVTLRNMWGVGASIIVFYPKESMYNYPSVWPIIDSIEYKTHTADTTHAIIMNMDANYLEDANPKVFSCWKGAITPSPGYIADNLNSTLKDTVSKSATRAAVNWVRDIDINDGKLNIVVADCVDMNSFCTQIVKVNYGVRKVKKYEFESGSATCQLL